jgi:hypothetical protein
MYPLNLPLAAEEPDAIRDAPRAGPQGVDFISVTDTIGDPVEGSSEPDVGASFTFNPENVTLSGSNLVFHNTYGVGVSAAYHSAIIAAENFFQSHFTNAVTLNMNFDMKSLGAGFSASNQFSLVSVSYATLRSALVSHATSSDDVLAANSLPSSDPKSGSGLWFLPVGYAKMLGLSSATDLDTVYLNSDFTWQFNQDAVGALEHEISEGAMGRIGGLGVAKTSSGTAIWSAMDLFRFAANGVPDYTGGRDGVQTFFGLDASHVLTGFQYHSSVSPSGAYDGFDFADWDHTIGDAFGPGGPGSPGTVSPTDLRVMDVIGWTTAATQIPDDYADSLTDTSAPFGQVPVNGSNTGTLEVTGDRDWFRVQLTAGIAYLIELKGQPSGSGTLDDPYLRVHDGSGAIVAENDDIQSGSNRDSRLTYVPAASGTFYLEAGAFNDGSTGTYRVALTAGTDHAPTIISNGGGNTASISLRENLPGVTTVAASDPEAGTILAYSIVGGADASDFQIDPSTGALYFVIPADYEHPADYDHNNSYVVQVSVSDGSLSDAQTLTITVNDGNDAVLGIAAPADFSHDGKDDILWRNASGAVALWSMNGAQKLADQSVSSIGNDWSFVSSADFTGDGKPDLLFRHDSGAVALWTMNGAQKVADQVVANIGNDWHLENAADFNGDGKADILWRHDNGTVALWTMNGAQKVADQVVSQMGNDWHLAATDDFNGDGKADILWRHDDGTVALWTMNGAQKVADQVVYSMDNAWKIADTADFNGDGKTDILWRNDLGAVDIWTMNGAQKVADQVVSNLGNDWHFVDTADFNGDGKADILWRHDSGALAVWTMNGGQKAADQVVSQMGNDWHVLGLGDFNGDGKADILWRHDTGAVALWTMNGAQKVADQIVSQLGHDWMLA